MNHNIFYCITYIKSIFIYCLIYSQLLLLLNIPMYVMQYNIQTRFIFKQIKIIIL